MNAQDFIKETFKKEGMQITDERAQFLGAADGLYPVLLQLLTGWRAIDTEQYEPLDKPHFFKERAER